MTSAAGAGQAAALRKVGLAAAFPAEPLHHRLEHGRRVEIDVGGAGDDNERRGPGRQQRRHDTWLSGRRRSERLQPRLIPAVERVDDRRGPGRPVGRAGQVRRLRGRPGARGDLAIVRRRSLFSACAPSMAEGRFLRRHREVAQAARHRVAQDAELTDRAAAADEFEPHAAAELLPRAERDDARPAPSARRACRRRPTRRSLPPRSRAAARSRAGSLRSVIDAASSGVANRIDTGRSSQTIRFASDSAAAIAGGLSTLSRSSVDRTAPRWKPTVRALMQAIEGRRQDVLARVLLHVIEAARPVHACRGRECLRPAGRSRHGRSSRRPDRRRR